MSSSRCVALACAAVLSFCWSGCKDGDNLSAADAKDAGIDTLCYPSGEFQISYTHVVSNGVFNSAGNGNFGVVPAMSSLSDSFGVRGALHNIGGDYVFLLEGSPAFQFSVDDPKTDWTGPDQPVELEIDAAVPAVVTVRFAPQSSGKHEGKITITPTRECGVPRVVTLVGVAQ